MSTDDTEPLPDPPPPDWMPPERRQPKPTPPSPDDPTPNDSPETAAIKRLARLVRIESTRAARESVRDSQRLRAGATALTVGSLAGLLLAVIAVAISRQDAPWIAAFAAWLMTPLTLSFTAGVVVGALFRVRL